MQNRRNQRVLFTALAATLVVSGLSVLFVLDARNLSRHRNSALAEAYVADYDDGASLGSSQQHQAPPDLSGSVTGSLVDENNTAIRGIEVRLIPLDKTGDRQWYATQTDWTNAEGRYEFPRAEHGEYILAVQKRAAPDGQHPFGGTYYPGVDAEEQADHVYVATGTSLELHPLRLRRIETVTLRIEVEFEDGTRPLWSNLLFNNLTFPDQAVIGDVAPGVENGKGEMILPVGFDYDARAKVDCAGSDRIETRESRPIQRIHIENSDFPEELRFTIPGQPCPLWSPPR
jgi:hypothetical protein